MDDSHSFLSLPNDIKKEILALAVRSTQEAISIQATSKGFQDLVWKSMVYFSDVILFDRSRTKKIFERIDKSAIKYLELVPLPPSPSNNNFELNLAEFSSLEYLSLESVLLQATLQKTTLKDAFMNHKTLTCVKCITPSHSPLSDELIHEISQTKKLYLVGSTTQHTSPTINYMTNSREFIIQLDHVIGGFDGAPTAGNAAGDYVVIGSDNGTVAVLKHEDEAVTFMHLHKAHSDRINHVHTHHTSPNKEIFIASSEVLQDGTVSLWDIKTNFTAPQAVFKCGEPIFHVCARVNSIAGLVLAAGKQTAYLFNIKNKELIKAVPIGSDIIMLDDDCLHAKKGFAICTPHRVHIINNKGEETVTHRLEGIKTLFSAPDHTVHVAIRENSAQLRIKCPTNAAYYEDHIERTFDGHYDAKPYTGTFVEPQLVVLLSTGYGFHVLDFMTERPIMSIGLPVTKKEIITGNFKQVVGLFTQEKRWYVIGSDGKLYSWRIYGKDNIESMYFSFVFEEHFDKF